MQILFPNSTDFFPLEQTQEEHNTTTGTDVDTQTLLQVLNEIEKKIGSNNSPDTNSLDYKIENLITENLTSRTKVIEEIISNKQNVTGTARITLTGTPTKSVFRAFGIDVNESNLVLNNIGGVLSTAKGGTGLTTSGANGNFLTSNGTTWQSKRVRDFEDVFLGGI